MESAHSHSSPPNAGDISAYDLIAGRIASGTLTPGTWIREANLADELGTSRTPVREALRSLAAEGLVEFQRNRGARVRVWSEDEVEETYDLRAMLEGHGARQAANKAGAEEVARLKSIQEELEDVLRLQQPGFRNELAELNSAFHTAILEIAASPLLSGFVRTLSSVTLVRRAFEAYTEDDFNRTALSHRDIIRAIATQNAQLAEVAMANHILAAEDSAEVALREIRKIPSSSESSSNVHDA